MRGGAFLGMFFLLLIVGFALVLAGTAFVAPERLSIPQEQIIGLLRGGVVGANDNRVLGDCTGSPPQAVPRTERVVSFADGSALVIIIYDPPQPCE